MHKLRIVNRSDKTFDTAGTTPSTMNTDPNYLNHIFKAHGDIIPEEKIEGELTFFHQFIKECNSLVDGLEYQYPKLPKIQIVLVNNDSLNACAIKTTEGYYIGINYGTIIILFDMFTKMMASRSIYTNIGNPEAETIEEKKINVLVDNGTIKTDSFKAAIPKDSTRYEWANFLHMQALHYLVYHEICHILRGHCDYHFETSNTKQWMEFDSINSERYLDSQTLEMDADSFAINRIFINGMVVIEKGLNVSNSAQMFWKDIGTYLDNSLFAIYCFFRITNISTPDRVSFLSRKHPHPSFRITMILSNILTVMERESDIISSSQFKIYTDSLIKQTFLAEDAYLTVTYGQNRINEILLFDRKGNEYVRMLVNNWDKLLPSLSKHAFHPEYLPGAGLFDKGTET
jgi:hypothetical protein